MLHGSCSVGGSVMTIGSIKPHLGSVTAHNQLEAPSPTTLGQELGFPKGSRQRKVDGCNSVTNRAAVGAREGGI